MSTTQELQTIFERINNRIDTGSEALRILNKIMQKRSEIEDKISDLLKSCVPDKYDKSDVMLNDLCTYILSQAKTHAQFAMEIKNRIAIPLSRFTQTSNENKKSLNSRVNRLNSQVTSVQKSYDNSVRDLEAAKAKLPTLPPNKQQSQYQTIQKLAMQVKSKHDDMNQKIMALHQTTMPSLHTDFSEFDSQRLQKIKQSIESLASLSKFIDEHDMKQTMHLSTKITNIDTHDRSQRFITRAFDPKEQSMDLDEELYAYAIDDYSSNYQGDLQFVRGDKIKVLQQHNSGWWDGELNGKQGLFPSSLVYMRNANDRAKSEPIGAVFLCRRDFNGKSGGEIKLLSGDLVYVDSHIGNKCSGQNLRTKIRGYFPLDVLESKIN